MKKMNKISIVFLCAISALVTSCKKDFLNTAPTDQATDEAIFSTTGNAANVINGVYRYLNWRFDGQNTPGHGGIMLDLDFMGEDINQSASNWYTSAGSGTGGWVSHKNSTSAWVVYPFRLYYRAIGNANALIEKIDAATGPEADKKRLKAEALTLRAWSYHMLVQIFGKRYAAGAPNTQLGVSMPLSSLDVKLPRSTVEENYTQIKKDLNDAIALFATASTPPNKSHLTATAAKAIMARVALVMQDYTTAASFAKQVIDGGTHSLMTNAMYQAGFNDLFGNPEWIWGAYTQLDQGDTFGSYFAQIGFNANTTYARSQPKRINQALYDLIPATDVRKKMWEPAPTVANLPLPGPGLPPDTRFVRQPYMSKKFSVKDPASNTLGDVPYIRLAEMYLILAEANAMLPGKEAEAKAALFTLAKNRDPNYTLSANTGQALLNEIWFQRRIELWGEGFRFLDLKRLNQPLDRTVVPNYVSAAVGGVMQIPAGDVRWQFAIPSQELDANPNSVQNP